jgi:hypothetical protein
MAWAYTISLETKIMRNLTYLFVVIIATACNVTPPTPVAPVPAPVPTAPAANAPQQDWTFTVIINGTTHKAEGTYIYPHWDVSTSTGYYFNLESLLLADNIAHAQSTQSLELSMLDKSESTYISGDHINITMSMNNLSLGVNDIGIGFGSGLTSQSIIDELPFATSSFSSSSYMYGFQNTQGTLSFPYDDFQNHPSNANSTVPINITDLGTQKEIDNSNMYNNPVPGNTIKGNYSGIVYSCDTFYADYTTTPFMYHYEFNTPTQISIDFEAIREY